MSVAVIAASATAAAGLTSAGLGIANAVGGSKSASGGSGGFPTYQGKFNPISNVEYTPSQMGGDLMSLYPFLQQAANAATANQTKQREKIMPGAANQLRQASEVLQSYLGGEVPQDVVDQTNRIVAERTGGGFNPFTGGGQSQSAFARSIGQTSLDITNMGLSAAPTWQQLANSFVVSPMEFGQIALGLGNQRYQYDALNTDINQYNTEGPLGIAAQQYTGAANQWGYGNLQNQQQFANQNSLAQGIGGLGGMFAQLAGVYRGRNTGNLAGQPLTQDQYVAEFASPSQQNIARQLDLPSQAQAESIIANFGNAYKAGR